MTTSLTRALLTLTLLLAAPCLRAASSERWIDSARAAATPEDAGQAYAQILLDEVSNEIDARGNKLVTHRYVLRLLNNRGAHLASDIVRYDSKAAQVKSLKAWLLRPGGKIETRNNKEWADLGSDDSSSLANDMRMRVVSFADKAIAGDIFAVETKVSHPMLTATVYFSFGGELPCSLEQFSVTVPAGFTLNPVLWGPRPPTAGISTDGRTWTWRRTGRPHRPDEPHMPSDAQLDARLIVRIQAPAGATQFPPLHFENWSQLASWIERLNAGQCDSSPSLAEKARELTANAPDQLTKIRAIASYVQKTRYISNAEGLSKGLGYVSRKASAVYATGFGDCKDKTNLMRSMLREIGITAYTAAANTEGRGQVNELVPCEEQFNHAICVVSVDESVEAPSVIVSKNLGHLLVFDPTDPYTHLGDLPVYLQGSLIHIEHPSVDTPDRLPQLTPEEGFRLNRRAHLTLAPNRMLTVACKMEAFGQFAARLRKETTLAKGQNDLDRLAMDSLGQVMHTGKLLKRSYADQPEQGRCSLTVEATAMDFVQNTQASVLFAKLDVLSRGYSTLLAEKERHLPLELPAFIQDDIITLDVPTDLEVLEIPRRASIENDYGSFRLEAFQAEGRVTLHRTFVMKHAILPETDYAKLKAFLSSVARADRSSVLLKSIDPASSPK